MRWLTHRHTAFVTFSGVVLSQDVCVPADICSFVWIVYYKCTPMQQADQLSSAQDFATLQKTCLCSRHAVTIIFVYVSAGNRD